MLQVQQQKNENGKEKETSVFQRLKKERRN